MSTPLDAFAWSLDAFAAVLDRSDRAEAYRAVREITDDRSPEELQRMVAILAVESVWSMRPKRSRRELRTWIERKRVAAAERERRADEEDPVGSVIWGPWGADRG